MAMEARKTDTNAAPADSGDLSLVFISFIRSIVFNKFRYTVRWGAQAQTEPQAFLQGLQDRSAPQKQPRKPPAE
jgi:hypothetical protein